MATSEYVYRVTRERRKPTYRQSAVSVKICSKRSLSAQLKSIQEGTEHARRYDRQPPERIVKIERAPIPAWEDVTAEFEV